MQVARIRVQDRQLLGHRRRYLRPQFVLLVASVSAKALALSPADAKGVLAAVPTGCAGAVLCSHNMQASLAESPASEECLHEL